MTSGSSEEPPESAAALLLAHLYNFGGVHANLIYELIRRLVKGFREAELQMLIVVLKAIGGQLRADDPLALKEIILEVQSRAAVAEGAVAAAYRSSSAGVSPGGAGGGGGVLTRFGGAGTGGAGATLEQSLAALSSLKELEVRMYVLAASLGLVTLRMEPEVVQQP